MKWLAFPLFLLSVLVGAERPCDQYTTTIRALERSTCIRRNTTEYEDAFHGFNGTRCRSALVPFLQISLQRILLMQRPTAAGLSGMEKECADEKVTSNCSCTDGRNAGSKRYCAHMITYTKDENAVNVTLGYCNDKGYCSIKGIEAYWEVDVRSPEVAETLKAYPRPTCIAPSINVSPELTAVAGCEYYCYKGYNKDIDDGRPCVMEWYPASVTGEPVVTLTGTCIQGICHHSASTWHTIDGLCHDSERFSKYGRIVESCKYRCPDLTKRDRPYGLTCLIRKTPITKRNEVGICKEGTCTRIREDDPCAMKIYNEKTVPPRVSKSCLCRGEPVANGTLCALAYSFGFEGYMLQMVGACFGGTCQERPPERPPKQTFKKRECKVENVQVTPELIVAGGCRATCRRYETEDRLNGTLCFRHYTRDTFGWFQKRRTYHIGECESGKCRYSTNSFLIKL